MKTEQERIDRAMELRDELFDLANSFAGDKTGTAAVLLHESCNGILRAKKWLDRTLDPVDAMTTLTPNDIITMALIQPRANQ